MSATTKANRGAALPLPFEEVRRCAASSVRRTDRVLMQVYDEVLAPSGLNGPQFGLLATIAEVAPIAINALATYLTIDRTTLTRNLALLTKGDLVRIEPGVDRRVRLVVVTPVGEAALRRAWPLWREAQARVDAAFGRERLDALLAELAALRGMMR